MLPYKVANKKNARRLRKRATVAEKKIWSLLLRKKKLEGFHFLRQKPLDNYIADFYCAELLLVIEIDGKHHLGEGVREYDERRTYVLNQYGIEVVRYSNSQILEHFECVEKDLKEKVKERFRKLEIGSKEENLK